MEFRLLGPVQVWIGDNQIVLKRRQERLLLAVLLLEPGRTVAADRLIELLWPEDQPVNPRRALQVYVSRVRTVLAADGEAALIGRHDGYAVELPAGRTDIEQCTALLGQARGAADLDERLRLLTDALALWRGPALVDVATDDVRRRLCGGLEESLWAAQELRLETELALGRHELMLPELASLCAAEPTREALAAARMLALYRSGRQTDALKVYADLVRHLDQELGLEPGPEIRELQVSILRQDDALQLQSEHDPAVFAPKELPADIAVLLGRDELLHDLSEHLGRTAGPVGVPRVVCLYGGAGMGKSAAAVRLGHQLAAAYPGGQLFVRLQEVSGDAVPAREVLGRMLRSLAVEPSRVPDSVEERSALFRSQLADRAVLLVFDDAADVAQIRPLLPATDHCAVVITSRQPLIGLEDAVHREVVALPEATGEELLRQLSLRESGEFAEVVRHCAGLPLALRIVGARLAFDRAAEIAEVAGALADDARRLDYLVAGDRAVRTSLDLTLKVADADSRKLLARLSLIGVDEFSAWVAAPLLGYDEAAAGRVLAQLVALGLVQLRRTGPVPTYGMHGLVRAYASELAAERVHDEVTARYLRAVLRLATMADGNVAHGMMLICEPELVDGPELPQAELDAARGLEWFDREAPLVRTAVTIGAAAGLARVAGSIAIRFSGYLAVRDDRDHRLDVLTRARDAVAAAGQYDLEAELDRGIFGAVAQGDDNATELRKLAERGLASADRSGRPEARVAALKMVAWEAHMAVDLERATDAARTALEIIESAPELERFRSTALDTVAVVARLQGRLGESAAAWRSAAHLSPESSRNRAIRLVELAGVLVEKGDPDDLDEADRSIKEARSTVDELGDRLGSAHVDMTEARLLIAQGSLERAAVLIRRADEMFGQHPDPTAQAELRTVDAWWHLAMGDPEAARRIFAAGIEEASRSGYDLAVYSCRRQRDLAGL